MSLPAASPAHAVVARLIAALDALNILDAARLNELTEALNTVVYSLTGPSPAYTRTDPVIPIEGQGLVYRFRTDTLPFKYRLTVKNDAANEVVYENTANFTDPNLLSFDVPAKYMKNGVQVNTFTAGVEYFFYIQGVADLGEGDTGVGQRQLVTKRTLGGGGGIGSGLVALLELLELLRTGHG